MDSLDRQLVHALFVDGRAAFSRIAAVLGVTNQTVARRYLRLRDMGVVRVLGRLDARSLGHAEWVIRLQCKPGCSLSIAHTLASRGDTHSVRLISGGMELVCNVQVQNEQDRDALLLDMLPATGQVTAISAHAMLHTFWGGPATWQAVTSALTDEQIAGLTPPPQASAAPVAPVELQEGDRVLLRELARDGRATHEALAAATHWHESTVRRRIAYLRASGALYFDVDIDERYLGYTTNAILWMLVEFTELPAVGAALAQHPQIPFVAATTGPTNLLASIVCLDNDALYDNIVNWVGPLRGIRQIETAPIIRTIKRVSAID